jgi:dipeptidyl aminopeptidase/acylaminoacyl peptidase
METRMPFPTYPLPRPAVHCRRAALFVALVLLALPAVPLDAQLTPEQVTQLQSVTSVALSPDGSTIAYTLAQPRAPEEDTIAGQRSYSELWIVPTDGGSPRALVQRPNSASAPQWSPDGRQVAFLMRGQVNVVAAAGGEPHALTTAAGSVSSFQWSPDGQTIAYTARTPEADELAARRRRGDDVIVWSERNRPVQLWVQPVAGGTATALTAAQHTVRDFTWAPDSRALAVQITEDSDVDSDYLQRRLQLVSAGGGTPRLVAETEGKLGAMAFSPDGERLAWIGATSLNDPLAQSVFVSDLDANAASNLTPDYEGSALSLGWVDARTIRFVAAEGTVTALNSVPAQGGEITRIVGGGAEIFSSVSFARDGRTFALAANTAGHPNEVFLATLRERQLRRLTNHNAALAGVELGHQETISWTARDGLPMEGVLIHPVGSSTAMRAPLAVLPHGGPEGISFDGWSTNALYPAQVLAGAGYAVFMPNYRGSGGRGVAFAKADHRDLAGREFEDVLDGIDHLVKIGVADSARVGISGTSYGGYFSAWAGTRHSERFRLAMPFAGISNWTSFMGTSDIPLENAAVHWDLWPWDHPGLVWERSPMAHIRNARTPMVIGQGLADERVPPEQMIQLHHALRLNGVESDLVLYPREPHGLLERQHQLDYMRRILQAFDRYVKPAARPAA